MTGKRLGLAFLAVAALLLAGCDWYQPGFDMRRSGYNPTESSVTVDNVATLQRAWVFTTGGTGGAPRLATGRNQVFAVDDANLVGIGATTGTGLWHVAMPGTPGGDPDACFGGPVAPGATYGPLVLVSDKRDDVVDAMSYDCGPDGPWAGGWNIDRGTFQAGATNVAGEGAWLSETRVSNRIMATYKTASGGVVLGDGGGPYFFAPASSVGLPAFSDTTAFLSVPGALTAVSVTTRDPAHPLWSSALTGGGTPTPSLEGNAVFVTDGNTVRAFVAATGAPLWATTLPAQGSSDAPALAGGRVYVRTFDQLIVLDAATGAVVARASLGSATGTATDQGSPTLAGGVVYVGSEDGKLLAFDAAGVSGCASGVCSPLASLDIGGSPGASRATPAGGRIFIGADHGADMAVYAFSLPS